MATRMREKSAARRENADKRPRATLKNARISPRKAAIVLNLIRGKQVEEALGILANTPKAASPILEKLLRSAMANAENNLQMDPSTLYVAEAYANQGINLKRYRAVSRGMAHHYVHRYSHITLVLDQIEE